MRRARIVVAVLLAAALTMPAAGASPTVDKIGLIAAELAQVAEDAVDGISCTATPAVGASHDLMVFTVVCQAKAGSA